MRAFIGIGTNSGGREGNIDSALNLIGGKSGSLLKISPVYETEPWGFRSSEKFLNLVAEIDTWLSPADLLASLLAIETLMGRRRDGSRYTSRVIDLDIIYYDALVLASSGIVIPHPLMHERKFVLVPLCDIAPDFVDPRWGKSVSRLLAECRDTDTPVKSDYKSPLSAKLK
jgi:2-amino-4-hydroxy-6-hydroxymethyldihydropteridine diphosphokinase